MIRNRAKWWVLVVEIIGMSFLSPLFAEEQNEEEENAEIEIVKEEEWPEEISEEEVLEADFAPSELYPSSAVEAKEEKILPLPKIEKAASKKLSQEPQVENVDMSLVPAKKKQKTEKNKPKFSKGDRPTLEKGTIFLAGSLSAGYKLSEFSYSNHAFAINSNISAGYFIKDRFALGLGVPASIKLEYRSRTGQVGLSVFSTYFFDVKKIFYPYLGADVTARFNLAPRTILLSAGINAGLLLGLNERVALDFCISPEIYFPLSDRQKWQLEVPLSFVGIRVFF